MQASQKCKFKADLSDTENAEGSPESTNLIEFTDGNSVTSSRRTKQILSGLKP